MAGAVRFDPRVVDLSFKSVIPGPVVVERITLTQDHLISKGVLLQSIPKNPEDVILVPDGGIQQANGIDFAVNVNFLSWDQMGLDNFLEINEVLTIQYST